MPTSPNLLIVEPASESDSQKVDRINTAINELDGAIAGRLSKSVAGSANVTLTRAEGIKRIFIFTGALTGSINVLFPVSLGCAGFFMVHNNTSGAFTLTVKTTAGGSTGVAVTQGKRQILYHDGTNVSAAAPEV